MYDEMIFTRTLLYHDVQRVVMMMNVGMPVHTLPLLTPFSVQSSLMEIVNGTVTNVAYHIAWVSWHIHYLVLMKAIIER